MKTYICMLFFVIPLSGCAGTNLGSLILDGYIPCTYYTVKHVLADPSIIWTSDEEVEREAARMEQSRLDSLKRREENRL